MTVAEQTDDRRVARQAQRQEARAEGAQQSRDLVIERDRALGAVKSDTFWNDILAALPQQIDGEWFRSVATSAIMTDPKLLHADRRTLATELMYCARMGLMPGGFGEVALFVDGNNQVQHRVEYQGILKLCHNSGMVASADAVAVYEGEHCELSPTEKPIHKFTLRGKGAWIGSYAYVERQNGRWQVEYMDKEAIMAHAKRYSDALQRGRQTPWNDPEAVAEMGNKTVLRRLLKYVPKSPQVAAVLAHENELDRTAMRVVNPVPSSERMPAPVEPQPHSSGWGRQYADGGNGNGAAAQDEQLRQQEPAEREQPRGGGEVRQQRQPEPAPEQTQPAAADDGGEARQQRRGRRSDEQITRDLITDIERAASAKELDEVMRGLKGKVATNPTYRNRIENAEQARRAQGFGNPASGSSAAPVTTAFGAPMRSWQDVASLVDAKLKEAEATGVYGTDGMDDPTYAELASLLDAAMGHVTDDVIDPLNRRLERFSDAGGPPPAEADTASAGQTEEPQEERYLLRDAVESYGEQIAKDYLDGLIAIAGKIPADTPGRAQKIGAIRGRNEMALSLLIERHRDDEAMLELAERAKDALEFPIGARLMFHPPD
jgi:phage RecT family recombinase